MFKFVIGLLFLFQLSVVESDKKKSYIQYSMKNTFHNWSGKSSDFTCQVQYEPTAQRVDAVSVKASVIGFDSNVKMRNSNALKVLEAKVFPSIIFESKQVSNFKNMIKVNGILTFHGVERPISFNAEKTVSQNKLNVRGRFSIKPTDYKIELPSLVGFKTEDNIDLYFEVQF